MTPRAATACLVLASLAVLSAQTPPTTPPQQTFRTATDAVIVDAAVRAGGKMVPELAAADFVLTDNNVRQTIDSVENTSVPIDLTLVVDVSGSPSRPWAGFIDKKKIAHAITAEVLQVTNLLRPTDRVRVIAIDRYVRQVFGFTPVSTFRSVTGPSIRLVEVDGLGSVYDTLAAALLHDVEPWRRHVVIARTKGRDSISGASAQSVGAIAERSEALFHLVVMETALDNELELRGFQANAIAGMGLAWPTNRFWVPYRRQLVDRVVEGDAQSHRLTLDGKFLQTGVLASGGDWHQTTGFSEPTLVGTFKNVFEQFRQGYTLRYTPRGVTASGWHTIVVTVPKVRGASVNARRGYGIEPPRVAPAPTPSSPRTLAELTLAYDRNAFQSVAGGLQQVTDAAKLLKDFEAAGNPWPAKPHREAAFAIDISEPGVFSSRAAPRDQAEVMLTRFGRLIRHPLEPDPFERQWHYAVLTLLQGTLRPNSMDPFITRALDRFPDEPRFLLARAIAADQRTAAGGVLRWGSPTPTMVGNLDTAVGLYEGLLGLPAVATEARIRLAFLFHRRGMNDIALARLDEAAAAQIEDGTLRYLQRLFRGRVLAELNRIDEALEAYRSALALLPSAQSARVSMMNALYRRGDRAEAESLAEQIQTESPPVYMDPWWMYWQGQYRLFPQVMARLREMAQ